MNPWLITRTNPIHCRNNEDPTLSSKSILAVIDVVGAPIYSTIAKNNQYTRLNKYTMNDFIYLEVRAQQSLFRQNHGLRVPHGGDVCVQLNVYELTGFS